jgi:hypothetical protein
MMVMVMTVVVKMMVMAFPNLLEGWFSKLCS